MDDGSIAELRRLQLRAYGPDGDIQADDAAVRRLAQLEELRRTSTPTSSPDRAARQRPAEDSPDGAEGAARPGPSAPSAEAVEAVRAVAAVGPVGSVEPVEPPQGRPRRTIATKWLALLWTASLVAVAAVVGGTALSAAPRAPLTAGAHHVATLAQDPDFTWPKFMGDPGGDPMGFRDYLGLTAVQVDGALWGGNADACLLLMTTEHLDADSTNFNGYIFNGCGAGAFPATVQLVVTSDSPAALRDRFPDGSALQFVLDDSRIDVYSDAE